MGLFDIGRDVLIGLYDEFNRNSPNAALMDDRARAGFEKLKRQREWERRFPARQIQSNDSSGNVAGKVLAGAALAGGAFLLSKLFGSNDDNKDKNTNKPQNPSNIQTN
ncbi:MAG: hypothetical protein IJ797_04200 [Selenomonadaceae bacterium]|nr:hypothetical protein [Selenomonadaceae bacterium]